MKKKQKIYIEKHGKKLDTQKTSILTEKQVFINIFTSFQVYF